MNSISNTRVSISIVTPVYNSEDYLTECIESVLKQTYGNYEHILVDDCSTDGSAKVVKEYQKLDSRVRLLSLEKNVGAGVARNRAIELATGRFIAFLDADDYWVNDKLQIQVDTMLETGASLSYTSYYVIDENSNSKYQRKVPLETNYRDILRNCYIFCSTAMYDTQQLGKVYMPVIRRRQDWVLWIRILQKVNTSIGVQSPLVYYREGNESLSKNKIKLVKANFNVYRKELKFSSIKSLIYMIQFLFTYFYYKRTSRIKV